MAARDTRRDLNQTGRQVGNSTACEHNSVQCSRKLRIETSNPGQPGFVKITHGNPRLSSGVTACVIRAATSRIYHVEIGGLSDFAVFIQFLS